MSCTSHRVLTAQLPASVEMFRFGKMSFSVEASDKWDRKILQLDWWSRDLLDDVDQLTVDRNKALKGQRKVSQSHLEMHC